MRNTYLKDKCTVLELAMKSLLGSHCLMRGYIIFFRIISKFITKEGSRKTSFFRCVKLFDCINDIFGVHFVNFFFFLVYRFC